MKKHLSTIFFGIIFLIGLLLVLYPTVSNFLSNREQKKVIREYSNIVNNMDKEEKEAMYNEAVDYNKKIYENGMIDYSNPDAVEGYNDILDVSGTGIMGYISIPKINVELPIYHGTSDGVLQVAVGHLEGSSLPVGGENTHCVLSGHRGLPSADLFTHLDRLNVHDIFTISVLDKTLVYEIDQIKVVAPGDTQYLQIEDGKDYCTLLTCTPYGINTHRLLVRGVRVADSDDKNNIYVYADAYKIDTKTVTVLMAVPLTLLLLLGMVVHIRRNKKRKQEILKIIKENDLNITNDKKTEDS
ncbi:lPXTG-site transpeptidase (Sortase) family protein [Eubacterium sp. CAG:603]|nr:lPXTG-site transpeptidase (Sortase) family protein [Eubacterium sp. CAG:603]